MLFFKTLKGVKFNPNPNPASTQHFLFTFITLSTKNFCLMLAVRLILMTPGSFYTTKSFSLIVLCAIRRRTCRIKSQVGPRKKRGFIVELRASLQRAGGDVGSGATDNCSRAIFAESIDRSRPPSRADLMCTSRAASVSTILSPMTTSSAPSWSCPAEMWSRLHHCSFVTRSFSGSGSFSGTL